MNKSTRQVVHNLPYKQDEFAYGIWVHVGPVLGWQPPKASN